jgi:hypothetical protein
MDAHRIASGSEMIGVGLAGVLHDCLTDAAIARHEARMAAGDVQAARTLARALRDAQAEIARLQDYRTRALRAEGALSKMATRRRA